MQDLAAKEKALAGLSSMSSAQIVSASVLQNTASARMFGTPGIAGNAVPMHTMLNSPGGASPVLTVKHELLNPMVRFFLYCEDVYLYVCTCSGDRNYSDGLRGRVGRSCMIFDDLCILLSPSLRSGPNQVLEVNSSHQTAWYIILNFSNC